MQKQLPASYENSVMPQKARMEKSEMAKVVVNCKAIIVKIEVLTFWVPHLFTAWAKMLYFFKTGIHKSYIVAQKKNRQ